MFLTKLFQYFRGYLIITVTGKYPERFFNVCAGRHILLWDVFPCSPEVFRCSVSRRGFCLLPPIVKKTGVQIKIIKKCGFPTVLNQLKKRKWFAIGLAAFFLLLTVLNLFIWKIELSGCENVSAGRVKEVLAECGLKVGAFRPFMDEKHLQNQVLVKIPELAWLWVDKSGSKVTVQVKERVPKPELFDKNAFSNITAAKDGVIENMIVKSGVPMVALGDTVRQGDTLVTGLIVSEKGVEPRKVQSEAEIYARVWYEKTRAFSLWGRKTHETGKKEKKYMLHIFGWNLPLYFHRDTRFAEYTESKRERELNLFGWYLGLGLTSTEYTETVTDYERLTEESVAKSGALEIEKNFDEEASPNAKKIESRMQFEKLDEDTIEVTVISEYIEDIAQKVYIE